MHAHAIAPWLPSSAVLETSSAACKWLQRQLSDLLVVVHALTGSAAHRYIRAVHAWCRDNTRPLPLCAEFPTEMRLKIIIYLRIKRTTNNNTLEAKNLHEGNEIIQTTLL